MSKYFAFKCIGCGKWSGRLIARFRQDLRQSEITKIIENLNCDCKYCKKVFKFKEKGKEIRTKHVWLNDNWEMSQIIKEKNAEGQELGFRTYK